MTDLELQKKRFEFSVKLCAAVKKHKCLHDRTALQKNSPQCRLAWEEVAKECNESSKFLFSIFNYFTYLRNLSTRKGNC